MAVIKGHSCFGSARTRLFIFAEYTVKKMKKTNHCNSRALNLIVKRLLKTTGRI